MFDFSFNAWMSSLVVLRSLLCYEKGLGPNIGLQACVVDDEEAYHVKVS